MSAPADLRAAIPATWQLVSYDIYNEGGTIIDRPFGERVVGTLVYTAGGHVSAHAMADERMRCGTQRPVDSPDELKIAAYDSYLGYAGTWTLDGDVISHHVETSYFPDWRGMTLRRRVTIDGDLLVLTGIAPHPPDPLHPPSSRIPVLTWTRDPRS